MHKLVPVRGLSLPFNPPALPLAVRSPYLSNYLEQGNDTSSLGSVQSNSWGSSGAQAGMHPFWLMESCINMLGLDDSVTNQPTVTFTPTRTSFLFTVGPMQINATFLCPIEVTCIC
ncbi:hypothetical protein DFH11DRAFT_1654259 [Phellopilus nigrolimitatus]|nr:hypothetical protein DFH11DRAFT_1654259 [Phellopilus nigrolimitatus]